MEDLTLYNHCAIMIFKTAMMAVLPISWLVSFCSPWMEIVSRQRVSLLVLGVLGP
jgi:hypothetical protein